ncbi:hypothetical protein PAXRUDRAFT_827530 [Paxillus rubicundulus Ve08.2h10]|uniref:Uncharacterized protein n=1 Tax=Paxillus rubicundulus Ve08.2h10 TaxID=930991 RepID=A0A0D0DCH8_9AGAM|nr:hypothetical protein PAXRUDRAFT_827530 [Paxillus rubicundulus Ve08.2h10]
MTRQDILRKACWPPDLHCSSLQRCAVVAEDGRESLDRRSDSNATLRVSCQLRNYNYPKSNYEHIL